MHLLHVQIVRGDDVQFPYDLAKERARNFQLKKPGKNVRMGNLTDVAVMLL